MKNVQSDPPPQNTNKDFILQKPKKVMVFKETCQEIYQSYMVYFDALNRQKRDKVELTIKDYFTQILLSLN